MNKEELLELLKTLNIDRNEFWVLSSGALVLRDIYPEAGDLDIGVSNKGLEQLKKNYDLKFKDNGWFIVSDKIEGVCDGEKEHLAHQPELVEGFLVQNIKEYYKYLLSSDREKDKKRIPLVEDYMEEMNKGRKL